MKVQILSSTRGQNQKGACRGNVWHQTSLWAEKGKIAGSIVQTDLHSWQCASFFNWHQDYSVEGGQVQICFLMGEKRPSALSRKGIREAIGDTATSTNLPFVLLSLSTNTKLLIWLSCEAVNSVLQLYLRRASVLITVPGIYPNEDKNMFCMQFKICKESNCSQLPHCSSVEAEAIS